MQSLTEKFLEFDVADAEVSSTGDVHPDHVEKVSLPLPPFHNVIIPVLIERSDAPIVNVEVLCNTPFYYKNFKNWEYENFILFVF